MVLCLWFLDPKLAPSLQQQAEDLAKQKVQDSLRHKIDHRPTREELIEHNILKGKKKKEREYAPRVN